MKSPSKPKIQMELRDGNLTPVTRYDAESMEAYKESQIFNVVASSERSNPHHKLYWTILKAVVDATAMWPTPQKLHNQIKFLTGYYSSVINGKSGEVFYVVDSISFESMDQQEFSTFFDAAMEILSNRLETDPMELLG
jgi:hypothetical protein